MSSRRKRVKHDYWFLPEGIRLALRFYVLGHSTNPKEPNWIGYLWYRSAMHDMEKLHLSKDRLKDLADKYGSELVGAYIEEILPRSKPSKGEKT